MAYLHLNLIVEFRPEPVSVNQGKPGSGSGCPVTGMILTSDWSIV